jgi:hypothetical protein
MVPVETATAPDSCHPLANRSGCIMWKYLKPQPCSKGSPKICPGRKQNSPFQILVSLGHFYLSLGNPFMNEQESRILWDTFFLLPT